MTVVVVASGTFPVRNAFPTNSAPANAMMHTAATIAVFIFVFIKNIIG